MRLSLEGEGEGEVGLERARISIMADRPRLICSTSDAMQLPYLQAAMQLQRWHTLDDLSDIAATYQTTLKHSCSSQKCVYDICIYVYLFLNQMLT